MAEYISKEILVATMREKAKDLDMLFDWGISAKTTRNWANAIENLPAANVEPTPNWISVNDSLPDIAEHHCSETILAYLEDGSYAFTELEETFFGGFVFGVEREPPDGEFRPAVTHWMPLPEPPKEDSENG